MEKPTWKFLDGLRVGYSYRWDAEEVKAVIERYNSGMELEDIAKAHMRSTRGVLFRLVKEGYAQEVEWKPTSWDKDIAIQGKLLALENARLLEEYNANGSPSPNDCIYGKRTEVLEKASKLGEKVYQLHKYYNGNYDAMSYTPSTQPFKLERDENRNNAAWRIQMWWYRARGYRKTFDALEKHLAEI